MRIRNLAAGAACALVLAGAGRAAVVGRTVPAQPVTAARLAELPAARRAAWQAYLARSEAARRKDVEVIARERAAGPAPEGAKEGHNAAASMPLKRDAAWYAGPEARHVADVIVSYQTPAGGWGKNMARDGAVRRPGQPFVREEAYLGTLDNDATTTELRFLARVAAQAPGAEGAPYRESFRRGVRYLLDAQYPNGGWPQIWPLAGGYHDAVTLNDGAMLAAMEVLASVAAGRGDYAFVPAGLRAEAGAAWTRALECLLRSQVVIGGRPTIWAQQYDALTLQPAGARNFEPRSLATAESSEILLYLMSLPDPSPAVVRAVHGGAAWLAQAPLAGKAWTAPDPQQGRRLVDQPGAPPLWARYYDIETGRPIYGDRDLTIHDDVNELSLERRNGYAWFNAEALKVAARYAEWAKAHPPAA